MIEKLKELSKDTVIYGISTILGRFLGFLLVPFYTNVFPTNEYGIYTYLYTIIAFLNVVYIYGMDAAYMKFASLEEQNKKNIFSTPFLFISFTSIVISLIILFFKNSINGFLNVPAGYGFLLYYMLGILFLDTVALIPFAALRLERKAAKFATIKIINIVINLSLNILLILHYKMGIEAIFISNLIASAFSLLALTPGIFKKLKFTLHLATLKRMIKFGIPYLPASMAAIMVQMIDVPILRELTDDSTVGVYRANYKLGIFMLLFVSMFQYAWQPFFLNNAKEKNAKEIFSKVLTLFVLVASLIWIVISLFIDNIAAIEFFNGKSLIGKDYLGGIYIVPIILFAYIFHGMYVNFQAGIYIEEKTKYFPYVTGTGAIINIVSNFLLIPVWGIFGAALSTFASYLVMAVFLYLVSQKFYKIDYEFQRVVPNLLLILVISLTYYYLYFNGMLTFLSKIILLVLFTGFAFLFGILRKEEILQALEIIQSKR